MSIFNKFKKFLKLFITTPYYRWIGIIGLLVSLLVPFLILWLSTKKPELILNDLSERILEFGTIRWQNGDKHTEISKLIELKLANVEGGSASIKKIWVEILDFKDDIPLYNLPPEPKLSTKYNPYKIIISPEIKKYIIVGDAEYHFPSGNEEKFAIAINSVIQGYYKIRLFVDWYDQKKPNIIHHLSSDIHEVFLEGVNLSAKKDLRRPGYKNLKKKLSSVQKIFEAVFFTVHFPQKMTRILEFLPKDIEIKILVPLPFYYSYLNQHKKTIQKMNLDINNIKVKPFFPFEKAQYEFILIDKKELIITFGENLFREHNDESIVKIYLDIFESVWEQDLSSYFNLSKDELIGKLRDKNPFIRRFVLNRLVECTDHDIINAVLICLTDPEFDIRASATAFLSEMKEIKAVGYLISMLNEENNRMLGIGGLTRYDYRISNIATIPILKLLEEENKREKKMKAGMSSGYKFLALMGIGNICDERILPLLQSIASNPNEVLRIEALEAIKGVKNNMEKIKKHKSRIYKYKDAFKDYYFKIKQINKAQDYFIKGCNYFKKKKYSKAEEFFKKSILFESRFPKALKIVGDFYYEWSTLEISKGNLNSGIDKCKESVKYTPWNYGVYLNWGKALIKIGRYSEASEKLKKAIELNPNLLGAKDILPHIQGISK